MPTVKEMVVDHLKANGFDGLWNCDSECACDSDDLAPCGNIYEDCQAGYLGPCDCGEHYFHIQKLKPEPKEGEADGCDHEWKHDGDGALYCVRCGALDPYSNDEGDPTGVTLQEVKPSRPIDPVQGLNLYQECPRCNGPLESVIVPWFVVCRKCHIHGGGDTMDEAVRKLKEHVESEGKDFGVEVVDQPDGSKLYHFTISLVGVRLEGEDQ